ncbi:cytochrome P450 4c3 [Nephila pilipes]|uniref:Cytochrome P450 4c3 n=1 Tax=Nephila pilipes TaxID=299642 RepID=A0A8X6TEM8_NEPPI|nr:cytochrome P450 4c3 [Nephila pilipes]
MNLLFYLSWLLSVYRQSQPDVPAFCLILQAVFGYIRVVIKEKIFCLYIFFKPFVLFYKPETAEIVLSSTKLIDKSKEYELLSQCIGKGLFISSGTVWRNRRKLLTPAFHFSILKEFLPIFQEQSSVLVSKLKALTREPWVDIVPLMSACALDIICEVVQAEAERVLASVETRQSEAHREPLLVEETKNSAVPFPRTPMQQGTLMSEKQSITNPFVSSLDGKDMLCTIADRGKWFLQLRSPSTRLDEVNTEEFRLPNFTHHSTSRPTRS